MQNREASGVPREGVALETRPCRRANVSHEESMNAAAERALVETPFDGRGASGLRPHAILAASTEEQRRTGRSSKT